MIAQTWVFVLEAKTVIGYVSISMGNVNKTLDEKLNTFPHSDVPGMLLGRLATHVDYEGLGIGRHMISWVFSEALRQSDDIGCRIVYLNPENETVGWYTKLGFKHIKLKRRWDIMFYDLEAYKRDNR